MKHFIPVLILIVGALLLSSCSSADPSHTVNYHEAGRTFVCSIYRVVDVVGEYGSASEAYQDASMVRERMGLSGRSAPITCEETVSNSPGDLR